MASEDVESVMDIFDDVIEKLSEMYLDYTRKIEAVLERFSDDQLREFVERLDESKKPWQALWGDRADAIIGVRWHHSRAVKAIEAGAPGYCVYHACDTRQCPPGAHDD